MSKFGWNWCKISMELPAKTYMEIKAMPHSCVLEEKDKLIWAATSNGEFNLASAYKIASNQVDFVPAFNGCWIWKLKILPKIRSFTWMCLHKSIATREFLAKRGILINPSCPLCHQSSESILHLLRDCPAISAVWHNLNPLGLASTFFSQDLHTWLETNCRTGNKVSSFSVPWYILFSFGIWSIWNHRNKVVFQNCAPSSSLHQEVIQRAMDFFFCAQGSSLYRPKLIKMIRWERPYRGWYKLNTDGSAARNPRVAGGGGVLRDDAGVQVKGFARQIGCTTSFLAELWALRDGLIMCLELHINALEIDLDAKVIADLMNSSRSPIVSNSSIVVDCRLLISRFP